MKTAFLEPKFNFKEGYGQIFFDFLPRFGAMALFPSRGRVHDTPTQWELIGTFRQKSKNFSDCSEIENKGQLIIVVRYFNKDLVIF